MVDLASIGSDVVTGSTALGGLQLVFLGAVVSDYNSFDTTQQSAVIGKHRPRAWQSVAGVLFCLASTLLALYGKWLEAPMMTYASILFLSVAIFSACISAIKTAMDVR